MSSSCCITRFKPLSGHGFNRAEQVFLKVRLQPLRAKDAPQGLKPGLCRVPLGTPEGVP